MTPVPVSPPPVPLPRPGDPKVTPALVREHGLSDDEYRRVQDILGREPTYTELGVFSAMWSEHCGYKSSRLVLRGLPTDGPHVLQGPGENAGAVDVGDGYAVVFKIESHNHPSAVEPYQGAATGVGGILRDIFTMGARPIAMLDSLRFGSLDKGRNRYLFDGVVRGIGDYGNCVGIPTVAGEVYFDDAYEANPLVNAMCVGITRADSLVRAVASGVGNPVLAVGSRTGRDGIHGATFASEELGDDTQDSRPQVQVGDPFTEKLLLEATLELLERGLVVAIQDMGAAGVTSSASEMAARGGTGIEIDVARVPVRQAAMTPYEILLSESQERMLLVAEPKNEAAVREVLEKWDLEAEVVGRVTDDGQFRVLEGERLVANIPVTGLVNECPVYDHPALESPAIAELRKSDTRTPAAQDDAAPSRRWRDLLAAPSIASKRWVYEQYDTSVGTRTVRGPGGDAAILRLDGTRRALAMTTDCNGRYVYLNPKRGGMIAVCEAARNLACVGARPLAITNCLNFGNPEKPEIYHQFKEAVGGMGDACRALGTPVTGGNVSFYNESPTGAVYPTPVVGMIGVIEDFDQAVTSGFKVEGDAILLLGAVGGELGGSEYLKAVTGEVTGNAPAVDLESHRRLVELMLSLAEKRWLHSAHDCAEGGLAVALAESAIRDPELSLGFSVDLDPATFPESEDAPLPALLFGETQGRIVVSAEPAAVESIAAEAERVGLPCRRLGSVTAKENGLQIAVGTQVVRLGVEEASSAYYDSIPARMERTGRAEDSG